MIRKHKDKTDFIRNNSISSTIPITKTSNAKHLAKVQKQKKLINVVDELLIKTGGDLLSRVSSTIGARGL
ncbi:hypothetical protein, partial [Cloacibacterium rupense]|uniref:hypothetical protein n=1 Tax=Cloacibacterium rupense TaxID=517423 RepID=UPI001E59D2BE